MNNKTIKTKYIIELLEEGIKIHTKLSKEIVGNNDYHLGAIDELKKLIDIINIVITTNRFK